jgi:hypothetical protein
MTSFVHSLRRRTLVVGLMVASFAGASSSAYAAPPFVQFGDGPPSTKIRTAKIPKRPKVVVERTIVRCDVSVDTAHPGDLWRCE